MMAREVPTQGGMRTSSGTSNRRVHGARRLKKNALLNVINRLLDRARILVMLQLELRHGELLSLHLNDGVRTKGRTDALLTLMSRKRLPPSVGISWRNGHTKHQPIISS
jgi:hypothetical protein